MDIIKSASFFFNFKNCYYFFCLYTLSLYGWQWAKWYYVRFSFQLSVPWDLNRYPGDSEYSSRISAVKMHIEKNNFSLIGFEYYLCGKVTVHVRWLRTSILRYSLFNFMVSISTKTEPTTAWQLMSWYVCWYQS